MPSSYGTKWGLCNTACAARIHTVKTSYVCVQAHVCHYTRIDAMEETEFDDSLQTLSTVVSDYRELERQIREPLPDVPRLQIV